MSTLSFTEKMTITRAFEGNKRFHKLPKSTYLFYFE